MTEMQLTSIFCVIEDFCNQFLPEFCKCLITKERSRVRTDCLSDSEIMTILIWFNLSGYKYFKHFYLNHYQNLKLYFPKLPTYQRFVSLQKKVFIIMNGFLQFLTTKTSKRTGIYYIDSTFMEVCKNQRIYRHKTFSGLAQRGFSSCGWFFGFKLHLITNHLGDIISFIVTKGNVSDGKMTATLKPYSVT